MSTQQDIYAAGSESRSPMLNKENYVPWSSRLLRKMIPEPGDANREITVTETFHLQTDDELSDKELKKIEADDKAIQTILLGLPEDIYAAVDTGSESRPPMLNKENYLPWSSRLLRYAKSRPNGKLIHNSILNGPYVKKMIPEPGDDREITVTETFHFQTDDELFEKELKQIEADDQAIQTILLGLPEDIYTDSAPVYDIDGSAKQMMKGSDIGIQEKKAKLFNKWERFTSNEEESIESYYNRFLKLMNDLKRNKYFPEKIASNLKFLNNLQPEWSRHVTIIHQTKDLHTADYTQLQYTRRARIAQSSALPPVADEPASPLKDVSEGEACPTDSGFQADQDRANIVKTSTLPHDSAPRVTSPTADEGSMQLKFDELMGLCTSLQRQHSEMVAKFEAQELEINSLKARVKLLEDREGVDAIRSRDDAPIKGRNLDEGEAAAERVSDDTEEMTTVLTSMDATTVLASGVAEVPISSRSIPTAGPLAADVPTGSDVVPTAGLIFATAIVVTPYIRRKGKEIMVESETPKKKKFKSIWIFRWLDSWRKKWKEMLKE
uniref:Gag-Pol polyprotein n=1 Tax=Tanacetum cinerariifolium TaxID=118510 RepID=A0A6L2N358_TANCI|nr:hypothetical protein [Tanacetum cinerariifolium]